MWALSKAENLNFSFVVLPIGCHRRSDYERDHYVLDWIRSDDHEGTRIDCVCTQICHHRRLWLHKCYYYVHDDQCHYSHSWWTTVEWPFSISNSTYSQFHNHMMIYDNYDIVMNINSSFQIMIDNENNDRAAEQTSFGSEILEIMVIIRYWK